MKTVNIFWFRRDLRLYDNAGLYYALKDKNSVLPIFIFDKYILDALEDKKDRRVEFIHAALMEMEQELSKINAAIEVYYGYPEDVFKNSSFKIYHRKSFYKS